MASNKNQHFVPRCHLKPFSLHEEGASISLFNVDRRRLIRNAPLKHQCAGDYFYGRDELLEKAIQGLESAYGQMLREVRQPGYVLSDQHKWVLRRFWLLQHLRTEAASRRSVEMASAVNKTIGEDSTAFRLEMKQAVQMAMRTYAEAMSIVDDLKVCLLSNRTEVPFLTSDDPAVATSRWYFDDPRVRGRSFGLNAAGLLALLPLTPRILCVAYDGDVYSIPHEKGWAVVDRSADVRALNQHQFLGCFANVFVHDPEFESETGAQFQLCAHRRLAIRHALHYAVLDKTVDGYSRYVVQPPDDTPDHREALIHWEELFPRPTMWPTAIRWRSGGSVFTNGTGVKYVRRSCAESSIGRHPFWKEPSRR